MILERFSYTKFGTLGRIPEVGLYTIELPWQSNKVNESCIPPGVYQIERHESPTFGPTLWLKDVPGRTEILIHPGNSPEDLDGCISPGDSYGWWEEREEHAVWNSRESMDRLLQRVPDKGVLEILPWHPKYP